MFLFLDWDLVPLHWGFTSRGQIEKPINVVVATSRTKEYGGTKTILIQDSTTISSLRLSMAMHFIVGV
jgi:hypothetical protein